MADLIGRSLSHYRITAALGAGGMGEVYRATDTTLNREVAIKLLPAEVAQDPERLARFRREAQLLAALNHPNVAAIHGLEEVDGTLFLALELVEGEDLSSRLERGPVPVGEALEIATQIANALQAAHEKAIVHRDLKPANVKITPEGQVKVLDFGLAKAWSGEPGTGSSSVDASQSPTLAHSGTAAGIILGTAAYMSPEQARGDAVDKQADIWAFGVVLFEMLTGRRLFEGRTISDVLASVLKDEPPWSQLPGDLPPGVERVLRRCLARDARDRFRDAGDIILALEDASAEPAPGPTRSPASSWRFAALLLVFAVAVGAVARQIGLRPEPPRLRRGTIPVSGLVTWGAWPTISPDGQKVAYLTGEGLWLHSLDSFDPVLIYEGGVETPFFSWDSERIAFSDDAGGLWQMGVDASAKRLICELPGNSAAEGVWLADDSIILSAGSSGMFRVPAGGGQPVPIEEGIETRGKFLEFVLPGEGRYGFVDYRAGTIEMLSDGSWTTLASEPDLVAAAYSKTGHLIYHRLDSGMWALPFDAARGIVTGGAFQIDPLGGSPSFSDAGRLVYPRGRDRSELVRVARDGTVRGVIGTAQYMLQDPSLSPDGRWIAVFSREQGHYATWLHEIPSTFNRRGCPSRGLPTATCT
jgi:serine/threonine-protein kinase